VCSINMRGRVRGGLTPYTPPRETLAATSSRPNSEVLATHVVLAHPRATFHPCTCGFRRGATAVAAALIGYDHVKVAAETSLVASTDAELDDTPLYFTDDIGIVFGPPTDYPLRFLCGRRH
jgi:hypothetical protein